MKTWIIFTNKTDIGWLKILRPGFRHCYALLHDGNQWITYDPIAAYTDIQTYPNIKGTDDLPRWYQSQGNYVVPVKVKREENKPAPIALYNCVEAIKRLIGLHHTTIITPYQLYKFLMKENTNG